MKKVIFIQKRRHSDYGSGASTGLLNSAELLCAGLKHICDPLIAEAIDGNCIDRIVTVNSPDIVILAAFWVTPAKIKELQKLHPFIKWVVRVHSETPFLATDSVAIQWMHEYRTLGVVIAFNSKRVLSDINNSIKDLDGVLLPNYYHINKQKDPYVSTVKGVIKVGCFGAARLLKNQLIQACAAISFAREHGLKLFFYMNRGNVSQDAESVMKNIRSLFYDQDDLHLMEVDWMPHHEFMELIAGMDICLQVSFSETFNITTADAVVQRIPVVVSEEIDWVFDLFRVPSTDSGRIVRAMKTALFLGRIGTWINLQRLRSYNSISISHWKEFLK